MREFLRGWLLAVICYLALDYLMTEAPRLIALNWELGKIEAREEAKK